MKRATYEQYKEWREMIFNEHTMFGKFYGKPYILNCDDLRARKAFSNYCGLDYTIDRDAMWLFQDEYYVPIF